MGQSEGSYFILLLYSLLVGIFLGVLWDFFRIIRIAAYGKRRFGPPAPIPLPAGEKEVKRALAFHHRQRAFGFSGICIFISDLLFCTTAALSVILLIFHIGCGEIRFFALFGAAAGFTVYYFTVGRLTVFFSDIIIKGIKKVIFLLLSVTFIPILRLLGRIFAYIFGKITYKIRKRATLRYFKKQIKEASVGFSLTEK